MLFVNFKNSTIFYSFAVQMRKLYKTTFFLFFFFSQSEIVFCSFFLSNEFEKKAEKKVTLWDFAKFIQRKRM